MVKRTAWKINHPNISGSFSDKMLASRQLSEKDLSLSLSDMHSCYELVDIEEAAFEIMMAIKKRIIIMGDYDVDGTMATTILLRFFRMVGVYADYYIPDRLHEGYGMSDKAVDYILSKEYDLVITVDNGIAAIDQIKRLRDNHVAVIVTDHHECKEELPPANAVVNCKRKDSKYPFSELCGAGVALKLVQALSIEFGLPEDTWMDFIEYAAIATVADVMPLVDENRIIVKEGIRRLKMTKKPALLNLLRVAERLENLNMLSADDIGYYIAPLINASSRVGDVHVAMDLLLTDNEEEAVHIANKLKEFNTKRKEIEKKIKYEANKSLMDSFDFHSVHPIICCGDDWHIGVIGIVAASMVTEYHRPSIILSKQPDGLYHGSCRNYADISIINMLNSASKYIFSYGGHKEAAGLKVKEEDLPDFCRAINLYSENYFTEDMFTPVHHASFEIPLSDVTLKNIEKLDSFAPFGRGNEYPQLVCKDVKVAAIRKMGKKEGAENAHLKITLVDNHTAVDAIGFFQGLYADLIKQGDTVSAIFKLSMNEWNGRQSPQLILTDISINIPERQGFTEAEDELFLYDKIPVLEIAEESEIPVDEYVPNAEYCKWMYSAVNFLLKTEDVIVTNTDMFAALLSAKGKRDINPFKMKRTLEMLAEAGYYYFKPMPYGRILISKKETGEIKKISETETYQRLQEESYL